MIRGTQSWFDAIHPSWGVNLRYLYHYELNAKETLRNIIQLATLAIDDSNTRSSEQSCFLFAFFINIVMSKFCSVIKIFSLEGKQTIVH